MTIHDLHQNALRCSKKYRKAELELLDVLQEINRRKGYVLLGYTSLFTYAVEALGLPAERVYQLNVVAKKCEQVPELKEAIREHDYPRNSSDCRRIGPIPRKGLALSR